MDIEYLASFGDVALYIAYGCGAIILVLLVCLWRIQLAKRRLRQTYVEIDPNIYLDFGPEPRTLFSGWIKTQVYCDTPIVDAASSLDSSQL